MRVSAGLSVSDSRKRGLIRSRSTSSELTAALSLDRSLRRFLPLPLDRSKRDARKFWSARRRSTMRSWRPTRLLAESGQNQKTSQPSITFLAKFVYRVQSAGDTRALARRIERRTEGIEFVANRIVLNDLGLQLISHGGWRMFEKSERHVCGKSRS